MKERSDRAKVMRTGLRRIGALVGGALCVALLFVLLVPLLVPEDALRAEVSARLETALDRPVSMEGARLAMWPRPHAVLRDVAASGISFDRVETRLAVLPLIVGRIRPTHLLLTDGRAKLPAAPDPTEASDALAKAGFDEIELERVVLSHGGEEISIVEGQIDVSGGRVRTDGLAGWNGEVFDFDVRIADLGTLATGTAMEIELDAPRGSLRYEGDAALSGLRTGRLDLSGPSLAGVLGWFGQTTEGADAVPFALSGEVERTAWGWELRDATVAVASVRGEGLLGLASAERYRISGTLAFDEIATTLATLRATARGFGSEFDADIRFSATRTSVGGLVLDEVAAALRADERSATLELGDARYGPGRAMGALTLPRDAQEAARVDLQLFDVPTEGLPVPWSGDPKVEGEADVVLALSLPPDGAGTAVASETSARFVVRDGRLSGLDLPTIARLGPDADTRSATTGETAFDALTGEALLRGRLLTLKDVKLSSANLAARFEGRVDLARGVPAIRGEVASVGVVSEASGGGLSLGPKATTFFVGGTLAAPLVVPVEAR